MRRAPLYRLTCRHAMEQPSHTPNIAHAEGGRWHISWGRRARGRSPARTVPGLLHQARWPGAAGKRRRPQRPQTARAVREQRTPGAHSRSHSAICSRIPLRCNALARSPGVRPALAAPRLFIPRRDGDVRFFEPRYFLGGQFQRQTRHRVIEMAQFRGPDDGRGNLRLLQHPSQGDLRAGNASRLSNRGHALDHPPVGLESSRIGVLPSSSVSCRSLVSSQLRVDRPRAMGLQGMTPTPWSLQSGSISRSSSR